LLLPLLLFRDRFHWLACLLAAGEDKGAGKWRERAARRCYGRSVVAAAANDERRRPLVSSRNNKSANLRRARC